LNFYNIIIENVEPFLLGVDFTGVEQTHHVDELMKEIIGFLPYL